MYFFCKKINKTGIALLLWLISGSVIAQSNTIFLNQFEDELRLHCDTETTLPCERVPEGFENLPDPTIWGFDSANGVAYRRATADEMAKNNWPPGTYLVDGVQLKNSTTAAQKVQAFIPSDDNTINVLNLDFTSRNAGLTFLRRTISDGPNGLTVNSVALDSLQFEYVQQGFDRQNPGPTDGFWARMLSGEDGGIYLSGMLDGLEFVADSASPGWQLDTLPTPPSVKAPEPENIIKITLLALGTVGTAHFSQCAGNFAAAGCDWLCDASSGIPCDDNPHIEPSAPQHCNDGNDNDDDDKTDTGDEECQSQPDWGDDAHPGFPRRNWESGKSFALMAEGRFCTHYAGNWIQRLTRMGWDSEVLVNQSFFAAFTGGEMRLRYRAGGCWIFPSLADANNCIDNGSGCPGGYPYSGVGSSASGYYNNVWDDVDHGTSFGLNDALHFAQTVYWGGTNAETTKPLNCQADEGSGCCGAAFTGGSAATLGASVVQYENSTGGCNANHAPATSAHEFGHNAGLDHDDMTGFMHSPAFNGSFLSPTNVNLLSGCLATWNCPRPSGFGHTP